MRLAYTGERPETYDAKSAAIVERVRDRRRAGGHPGLVELDRTLLHSPPLADGWNSFLGAVRTQTEISSSIRELIICRVASLNKAEYEWKQHEPILSKGLLGDRVITSTEENIKNSVIAAILTIIRGGTSEDLAKLAGIDQNWSAKAKATMEYTDAMTKNVTVPTEVWDELKNCFQDSKNAERELVEITATCAAYNCVSRFLVALQVGE